MCSEFLSHGCGGGGEDDKGGECGVVVVTTVVVAVMYTCMCVCVCVWGGVVTVASQNSAQLGGCVVRGISFGGFR